MSFTSITFIVLIAAVAAFLLFGRGGTAATSESPDAAVVAQLRKAGSDLSKPHNIEFFMYFPTETAATHVAEALVAQGFLASVKPAPTGGMPWSVLSTKAMIPDAAELGRLRGVFTDLCAAQRGEYDGWGSPVVK